jgi:hypothetical protein
MRGTTSRVPSIYYERHNTRITSHCNRLSKSAWKRVVAVARGFGEGRCDSCRGNETPLTRLWVGEKVQAEIVTLPETVT